MVKNCLIGILSLISLVLCFALYLSMETSDGYKASYLLEQEVSKLKQQYLNKPVADLPKTFQSSDQLSQTDTVYYPRFDIDGLDELDYFGIQVTVESGKIIWIGKYKP